MPTMGGWPVEDMPAQGICGKAVRCRTAQNPLGLGFRVWGLVLHRLRALGWQQNRDPSAGHRTAGAHGRERWIFKGPLLSQEEPSQV